MTAPTRVLRRAKGLEEIPGRHLDGTTTQVGNPFVVGTPGVPDAETAVRLYRQWLPEFPLFARVSELSGHDLLCFCPLDRPCPADVLLELANP